MTGIGLDFGTGLTKVAQYTSDSLDDPSLRAVQTAVAYKALAAWIPEGEIPAGDGGEWADAVRCDGFPAMLDTPAAIPEFMNRTAAEVTSDFLRLLLEREDRQRADPLDVAPVGPAARPIVIAVRPQAPAVGAAATARRASTGPGDVLAALGRSPRRLVASPVASLLYLRHERPELVTADRFVVCDVGAGSAWLSLCTTDGRRTRLVDSAQVSATSVWTAETQPGAAGEQRAPGLVEGLAAAIAGTDIMLSASPSSPRAVRAWRALEAALQSPFGLERLEPVLERASAKPHLYRRTVALRVDGHEVTAECFLDACAPIADRCAVALARLISKQADPVWTGGATTGAVQIILTGGLSGFEPIRAALLSSVGLEPGAPGAAAVQLGPAERLGAPAFGAALIAAGHADPGDHYPHALQMSVHRQVRGLIVTDRLELAAAGSIDLDIAQTRYLRGPDGPVLVKVRAAQTDPAKPIPVEIVLGGQGVAKPATFQPGPSPLPGTYRLGVRGGPTGAEVVLQHVGDGATLYFQLVEPRGADSGDGDG